MMKNVFSKNSRKYFDNTLYVMRFFRYLGIKIYSKQLFFVITGKYIVKMTRIIIHFLQFYRGIKSRNDFFVKKSTQTGEVLVRVPFDDAKI